MSFIVICRDDSNDEEVSNYVLAIHRQFDTRAEANSYASTIATGRDAIAVETPTLYERDGLPVANYATLPFTEITDEAGNIDLCEVEPPPSTRVIRVIRRLYTTLENGITVRVDLDTEPMTDLSQLISSLQSIQRMGAKIITKADALAYVNANSFAHADRPRPAGVPFNCNPKEN